MSDLSRYTEANRRAWNEIAEVRERAMWPRAAFFAAGGSTLDGRVLGAAGDVRGKRLLHLQCATGEDTLSWAVAGAVATGVDISEAQIDLARRKASEAELDVRFVASDVYALPADLQRGGFDLVYTGGGVLPWLPDIERWAQVVAAALRPGGRLLLFDGHPVANVLEVVEGEIRIEGDYFARGRPHYDQGWRHFDGGEEATETKVEFQWSLGDVVTAVAQAGLCVERLEEYPSDAAWRFGDRLEEAQSLPGEFLLVAVG